MMMLEVPANDRPRERMLANGCAALSDSELLAALFGSGIRGASALELGQLLLARFGGVGGLARAPVSEFVSIRGMGSARGCALAAALELGRRAQVPRGERPLFESAHDVFAYAGPSLSHLTREVFHVLCIDSRSRLMRDACVSEGGVAQCSVHPREVYSPAVQECAAGVIFVHNHPSGDPGFSEDDYRLTAQLKAAGKVLGIPALDHIVIGDGVYASMREAGRFAAL